MFDARAIDVLRDVLAKVCAHTHAKRVQMDGEDDPVHFAPDPKSRLVSGSLMPASACFHNVPAGALSAVHRSRCQPAPDFRHQYDFFHVSTAVEIGGIHHGADLDQRVNFRRRVPFL